MNGNCKFNRIADIVGGVALYSENRDEEARG